MNKYFEKMRKTGIDYLKRKVLYVEPVKKDSIGNKIDMRGQGSRANTSVKVLVNGVAMNMVDSAHAFG